MLKMEILERRARVVLDALARGVTRRNGYDLAITDDMLGALIKSRLVTCSLSAQYEQAVENKPNYLHDEQKLVLML